MVKQNDRPMAQRLGRAIGRVAPGIAAALGGPLAGAATEALSDAILGETGVDDDGSRLEEIIFAGSPQTMAALREAELKFRHAVLEAGTRANEIAASDRASARARQIALKDATPTILGLAVIGGFFAVLVVMLSQELPPQAETEFSIMLGALATMTAAVVNYFFGSSADSREKTQIMAGHRDRRH